MEENKQMNFYYVFRCTITAAAAKKGNWTALVIRCRFVWHITFRSNEKFHSFCVVIVQCDVVHRMNFYTHHTHTLNHTRTRDSPRILDSTDMRINSPASLSIHIQQIWYARKWKDRRNENLPETAPETFNIRRRRARIFFPRAPPFCFLLAITSTCFSLTFYFVYCFLSVWHSPTSLSLSLFRTLYSFLYLRIYCFWHRIIFDLKWKS